MKGETSKGNISLQYIHKQLVLCSAVRLYLYICSGLSTKFCAQSPDRGDTDCSADSSVLYLRHPREEAQRVLHEAQDLQTIEQRRQRSPGNQVNQTSYLVHLHVRTPSCLKGSAPFVPIHVENKKRLAEETCTQVVAPSRVHAHHEAAMVH